LNSFYRHSGRPYESKDELVLSRMKGGNRVSVALTRRTGPLEMHILSEKVMHLLGKKKQSLRGLHGSVKTEPCSDVRKEIIGLTLGSARNHRSDFKPLNVGSRVTLHLSGWSCTGPERCDGNPIRSGRTESTPCWFDTLERDFADMIVESTSCWFDGLLVKFN
jgi:hypothetical protein